MLPTVTLAIASKLLGCKKNMGCGETHGMCKRKVMGLNMAMHASYAIIVREGELKEHPSDTHGPKATTTHHNHNFREQAAILAQPRL
jgi:hypothetical protein